VKTLLSQVDPEFIGKLAIYAHEKSLMKDLPAVLVAYLASDSGAGGGKTTPIQERKLKVLRQVFPRVIDSGNMLRNFVQIIRSSAFGRKSFGDVPRKLIRNWFDKKSASNIFFQSIGNSPSLADVIKIVKPKPNTPEKAAVFAYLLGAEISEGNLIRKYLNTSTKKVEIAYSQPYENLPEIIRTYEAWKKDKSLPMPAINFRFLDNEKLTNEQWYEIACNANWITTLKNLNSFASHGVFDNAAMTGMIASRLVNAEEIKRTRVFPYQIMMAYMATSSGEIQVPTKITNALQDAMEIACENVPSLGKVKIFTDVSGSMSSPVTGNRGSATSKVRCIDVAALFSVSMLRRNAESQVIPFENNVVKLHLNPRDSIMTNAKALASIGGGGTNCSAPLALLNSKHDWSADVLIYFSDNESWVDRYSWGNSGTETMKQWTQYKSHNKNAKLICVDLTPNVTSQVKERDDILQIGGFSDSVFTVIEKFVEAGWSKDFWVKEIEAVSFTEES
jgi:60 kDa SS-A/Ro ribonucleoprotein